MGEEKLLEPPVKTLPKVQKSHRFRRLYALSVGKRVTRPDHCGFGASGLRTYMGATLTSIISRSIVRSYVYSLFHEVNSHRRPWRGCPETFRWPARINAGFMS